MKLQYADIFTRVAEWMFVDLLRPLATKVYKQSYLFEFKRRLHDGENGLFKPLTKILEGDFVALPLDVRATVRCVPVYTEFSTSAPPCASPTSQSMKSAVKFPASGCRGMIAT